MHLSYIEMFVQAGNLLLTQLSMSKTLVDVLILILINSIDQIEKKTFEQNICYVQIRILKVEDFKFCLIKQRE